MAPRTSGSGKSIKKIISLDSDKNRNLVNIYYVESYKRYNALEVDEPINTNQKCFD